MSLTLFFTLSHYFYQQAVWYFDVFAAKHDDIDYDIMPFTRYIDADIAAAAALLPAASPLRRFDFAIVLLIDATPSPLFISDYITTFF